MHALAWAYHNEGQIERSRQLLEETLPLSRRALGDEHELTLAVLTNLADIDRYVGRCVEAEKAHRKVLDIERRVLGKDHSHTLASMHHLAMALCEQGRFEEAEKLLSELLEAKHRVLGPEHPNTLNSMQVLTRAVAGRGGREEAESLDREAFEIGRRVLRPTHPDTLRIRPNLAARMFKNGKWAEAEAIHRQVLEIRRRLLGPEDPATLKSMCGLANATSGQGRHAEGERMFQEVLKVQQRVLGPEHAETLRTRSLMLWHYRVWGDSAREKGDNQAAVAAYRKAIELSDDGGGPHINLALALRATGDYQGALAAAQKAKAYWRKAADADLRDERANKNLRIALKNQATTATNWSWTLSTVVGVPQRNPAKAAELAKQAIELEPDTANHWNNLGVAQYRAGNWQAAVDALTKADAMISGGDRASWTEGVLMVPRSHVESGTDWQSVLQGCFRNV